MATTSALPLVEISLYPSAKDVPYQKDPDSRTYTGSFGAVYKAYSSTRHEAYAVKEIHADQDTVRKSIEGEIQLLRHCDHVNVLKLVGVYRVQTIENTYFLVTEPWAPMTLRRFLVELSDDGQTSPCLWWNAPQDLIARDICQGLIDGLAYLHGNNIKHKDIKPENLLLHQSNPDLPTVRPIIADFGISKIFEPGGTTAYTNATVDYLAPEQIRHIESGLKADVFSMGCCFLLILGAACDGGKGVSKIEDAVTRLPASCQYGRELKRIALVLDSLVASGRGYTRLLGSVVRYMLGEDPHSRPEAKAVQRLLTLEPEDWLSLEPNYPRSSDPFVFNINILSNQQVTQARLSLDTGSEVDIISRELSESLSLPLRPVEAEVAFMNITGTAIRPIGKVDLTWSMMNETHTRTTEFFVIPNANASAGIILGSKSLIKLGILKLGSEEEHQNGD